MLVRQLYDNKKTTGNNYLLCAFIIKKQEINGFLVRKSTGLNADLYANNRSKIVYHLKKN